MSIYELARMTDALTMLARAVGMTPPGVQSTLGARKIRRTDSGVILFVPVRGRTATELFADLAAGFAVANGHAVGSAQHEALLEIEEMCVGSLVESA